MKKVVIFGGTGGLGSQVTERLTDYELLSLGSRDLDVTNSKAVQHFFETNDIDIVINMSGINHDCFIHKLPTCDEDMVNKQIDVNIKGNLNILRSCLANMRNNLYGRIITISSVLAERPVVGTGVYAGCKGFIDSLVKVVALENSSKNINCNSIQLGYFDGGLTYNIPQQFRQSVLDTIPMNRWGTIDELENTIRFLIDTPYVTGTNIKINGGIDF